MIRVYDDGRCWLNMQYFNLVPAGEVAPNSVADGRIMREGPFAQVYTQPNAGDAAFRETGAPLFVDWVQVSPNGNRLIAARIAEYLEQEGYLR